MYDLAGIVIRAPAERLPDLPATTAERDTMLQTMRALYTTAKVDPFFDVPVELAPIGRAPLPVLSQVWRRVVIDHGGPFLAHRFATFGRVVGLGDMHDCAVVSRQPTAPDPPELAVVLNTAALPQPYSQSVFYWRAFPIASPLFRPITYVLIAVVAGAATVAWQPSNPVTVWVRWSLAAGLAYLSTFLALPQACDGRYSFLPIALILLATTVLAQTSFFDPGASAGFMIAGLVILGCFAWMAAGMVRARYVEALCACGAVAAAADRRC